MASKERIQRLKEETRTSILEAAYEIVKEEGWQALSMRKIADKIEYTAPIIYEYFSNKEAILEELTRKGYLYLAKEITEACNQHELPAEQLEAMWMAYWHFAFKKKELYQLMFGVSMNCCAMEKCSVTDAPHRLIKSAIQKLRNGEKLSKEELDIKFFTFWSAVHGLVSINLVNQGGSDEMNKQVLKDAITGVIRSITD